MKIKPLGDRVLVEVQVVQEKSKGGLFIPQTAQESKNTTGVVKEIGSDVDKKLLSVNSKVLFDQFSGNSVKDGDKEYLILNFSDILAVIE